MASGSGLCLKSRFQIIGIQEAKKAQIATRTESKKVNLENSEHNIRGACDQNI